MTTSVGYQYCTVCSKLQLWLHLEATVDDSQMGHINQVGHLSKTPLNLLEIHDIGSVGTSESKQQNYDQI